MFTVNRVKNLAAGLCAIVAIACAAQLGQGPLLQSDNAVLWFGALVVSVVAVAGLLRWRATKLGVSPRQAPGFNEDSNSTLELQRTVGVTGDCFNRWYRPLIKEFSEATVIKTIRVLKRSRSEIFDSSNGVEQARRQADRWTYALFCALLVFHEKGQPGLTASDSNDISKRLLKRMPGDAFNWLFSEGSVGIAMLEMVIDDRPSDNALHRWLSDSNAVITSTENATVDPTSVVANNGSEPKAEIVQPKTPDRPSPTVKEQHDNPFVGSKLPF